MVSTEHGK